MRCDRQPEHVPQQPHRGVRLPAAGLAVEEVGLFLGQATSFPCARTRALCFTSLTSISHQRARSRARSAARRRARAQIHQGPVAVHQGPAPARPARARPPTQLRPAPPAGSAWPRPEKSRSPGRTSGCLTGCCTGSCPVAAAPRAGKSDLS